MEDLIRSIVEDESVLEKAYSEYKDALRIRNKEIKAEDNRYFLGFIDYDVRFNTSVEGKKNVEYVGKASSLDGASALDSRETDLTDSSRNKFSDHACKPPH